MLRSLQIDRTAESPRGGLGLGAAIGIGLAGIALGAAGILILRSASPHPAKGATQQNAVPASQIAANAPAPAGSIVFPGFVVARRSATVAAEVIGRVVEVRVEEGQSVRKGEILAILDATLPAADLAGAKARVAAAEAEIAADKADLVDARLTLERAEALAKSSFASQASVTTAKARLDSLAARIVEAEANRTAALRDSERAAGQLARYEIRAPFSGVVVDKAAQAGEIISPSSAGGGFTRTGICSIVDMDSREIEVDVAEAYISRVSPGQKAVAVLDAYPDVQLPAHVIAVIPTASRDKAAVRVRVAFDGLDPRILPEMGIKVTFFDSKA